MSKSPINPTDDNARCLAREIMGSARFASLGVIDPETQNPFVSRISFGLSPDGAAISLISEMAFHSKALQANPACSLLIGEPPNKGDPLAFPRLTLQSKAVFLGRDQKADLRSDFLNTHPKAELYIDLADFRFVKFETDGAFLNGGFGKAFVLSATDLAQKNPGSGPGFQSKPLSI